MNKENDTTNSELEKNPDDKRLVCFLSYIGILWLVGLILYKDDKTVRFHVNQGIILSICSSVAYLAINIVSTILFSIAHMFTIITSLFSMLYFILLATFIIIGLINVYRGEEKPLPYIGTLFTVLK